MTATRLADCCSCCAYCKDTPAAAGLECCQCCGSAACRGVGTVSLAWARPPGPLSLYQLQSSFLPAGGGAAPALSPVASLGATDAAYTLAGLLMGRVYGFRLLAASSNLNDLCAVDPSSPDCASWFHPPADCPWHLQGGQGAAACPGVVVAAPYTAPTASVEPTLRVLQLANGSATLAWTGITSEQVCPPHLTPACSPWPAVLPPPPTLLPYPTPYRPPPCCAPSPP